MAIKVRPLSAAQRTVIKELALCFIYTDIEQNVVSKSYEESTGKKYDPKHKDSFFNQFLANNPKAKQCWDSYTRAIKKEYTQQRKYFEEQKQ